MWQIGFADFWLIRQRARCFLHEEYVQLGESALKVFLRAAIISLVWVVTDVLGLKALLARPAARGPTTMPSSAGRDNACQNGHDPLAALLGSQFRQGGWLCYRHGIALEEVGADNAKCIASPVMYANREASYNLRKMLNSPEKEEILLSS